MAPKLTQGDTYYRADVDEEDGYKVGITEYVLRTIRGRYGYLVMKESFTWGKRSKKIRDYGWLDPIPAWCRTRFHVDNGVPTGYAKSKSQALRAELASQRRAAERDKADGLPPDETIPLAVKALTTRLKGEMTRKAKASGQKEGAREHMVR